MDNEESEENNMINYEENISYEEKHDNQDNLMKKSCYFTSFWYTFSGILFI